MFAFPNYDVILLWLFILFVAYPIVMRFVLGVFSLTTETTETTEEEK